MSENLYGQQEIPAILDVPALAAFLGIGRNSAYALIRSGQVKALKIGRKIRIPRHAVLSYLGATVQQ